MGNRKVKNGIVILAGLIILPIIFSFYKSQTEKVISLNYYQKYDDFGLKLSDDESFTELKSLLNINGFVLNSEHDEFEAFVNKSDDNNLVIEKVLKNCEKVSEILMTKKKENSEIVSYYIDYINKDNRRIILTYTAKGWVSKTIKYKFKVIEISNDLIMKTYYLDWRKIFNN